MASNPQLLRDIRVDLDHPLHRELRPIYQLATARRRVPNRPDQLADMDTVSDIDNLGQAIMMRLLTSTGELAQLAHPEYGSRLNELIGQPNTATTRNLAKLFILQSLRLEPRVRKVAQVVVTPSPGTRDRIDIQLAVQPVGAAAVVHIGPFTLELAP